MGGETCSDAMSGRKVKGKGSTAFETVSVLALADVT